ncbi:hypothetical protein Poli38472_000349 [Pythium oligandrum]|uniref:Uncharacterized protein n=1 Tax=Pythium oligandrum TaxID=41045 RepID=A0A8K1CBS4_PYTOL|nr:hypothetical protein Poli38472_000349 [Pythium oligandrum]|eukprot:TMW60307.1 hypothetical protein Poli38472_000349 [Pythium oligandrum]
MNDHGGRRVDGSFSTKRRATGAAAMRKAFERDDSEDVPPLSTLKKSKRVDIRDESEFVSVEVGLRELRKRMATTPENGKTKKKKTKAIKETDAGYIDDDFNEDLAFLQALEDVERRLQPTDPPHQTPAVADPPVVVKEEPLPAPTAEDAAIIIKQEPTEVDVAPAHQTEPVAVGTESSKSLPVIPAEILEEYERLKRENEALRRSNEELQAKQVAETHEGVELEDTRGDLMVKAAEEESSEPEEMVEESAREPPVEEPEEASQATTEDMDVADLGDGDGLDDVHEDESDEDEEEEEDDDKASVESRHSSTIDRGNYDEYKAQSSDEEMEGGEEDDEDDEDRQTDNPSFDAHVQKSPEKDSASETQASPQRTVESSRHPTVSEASESREVLTSTTSFEEDPSETESEADEPLPHAVSALDTPSSEPRAPPTEKEDEDDGTVVRKSTRTFPSDSSSSESESDEEEDATSGNALMAALRAAGAAPPAAADNKPRRKSSVSSSPAVKKETPAASPSAASTTTAKSKKRRSTDSAKAKDKSTLLWPTLDEFYDFVLDLSPRRVYRAQPSELAPLKAYEATRKRWPTQYQSITQYRELQSAAILEELLTSVRQSEELSPYNNSRVKLWLSSVSPCAGASGGSKLLNAGSGRATITVSSNVILAESGFSGTGNTSANDFILTFHEGRLGPNDKSALGEFVSGDLIVLQSPKWKDDSIYAFGVVLCSSVVAVGGSATGSDGGSSSGSAGNNQADQLCVLIRAPQDKKAFEHFSGLMEMCLVNQRSRSWCWSLEQAHNLTTSAREFQAIKSVRFFQAEIKEMLLSGTISETVKTEQAMVLDPKKKLTPGMFEELEKHYNASQLQAILGAISDQCAMSIIQGPPGTGKTKTILGVLTALLDGAALSASRQTQVKSRIRIGASLQEDPSSQAKKSVAQSTIRILVAAPSNAAVDELIVRLLSEGIYDARTRKSYHPRIVRVGRPESLRKEDRDTERSRVRKKKWRKYASEVEEILLENLVNKHKSAFPTAKQARQSIIQNAQIVFCTLSGAGSVAMCELDRHHFDALVIDEAAQAVEASLLIPFKFQPSRVVLVGDHRQLPATVISKRLIELGYDRSLFERLVENGSRVFLLAQQYRMHPSISWFPSTYFYSGKLIEAPEMKDWTTRKYHSQKYFQPFVFYDVLAGQQSQVSGSKSLRNLSEVDFILSLLSRLVVEQYPEIEWKRRIGIIAPYKQQIFELRAELQRWEQKHDVKLEIEVNTVDGFQGREKEVIIYSCVRTSRPHHSSRSRNGQPIEAFWADERRMNVAITRAKSSLWIIGNSSLLEQSKAWHALIRHAKDKRCYLLESDFDS